MWVGLNTAREECETCGPSYDELTVEFTDEGQWEARLSVGCYGGGEIVGSRAEVIAWIRAECADLLDPLVMADAIAKIEAA